ncbi:MAG: hypothetical protein MJE68_16515 [Proteobacteria bacterium]|nr:hypothetical protein [Pseudomonadota bacterium]
MRQKEAEAMAAKRQLTSVMLKEAETMAAKRQSASVRRRKPTPGQPSDRQRL